MYQKEKSKNVLLWLIILLYTKIESPYAKVHVPFLLNVLLEKKALYAYFLPSKKPTLPSSESISLSMAEIAQHLGWKKFLRVLECQVFRSLETSFKQWVDPGIWRGLSQDHIVLQLSYVDENWG